MEKAIRITKTMRFTDILLMLQGKDPVNGTTLEDAEDFINHEVELLSKKNGSRENKLTATQEANKGYQDKILDYLYTQSEGKTCTEIGKGVPELSDFNNQKIAALMRHLCNAGEVVKTVVKGKSLFSIGEVEEGV